MMLQRRMRVSMVGAMCGEVEVGLEHEVVVA